jgi:NADPH:quinone reductase
MKAIRIHETGGPEVMRLEEVETPRPGWGEVRIKVVAAGVSHVDLAFRQGTYRPFTDLPITLGSEVAGIITALGPGVMTPTVGTRVIALAYGGYAEYAVANASTLLPIPENLNFAPAAAFLMNGTLASQALHESGRLQAGESVLVHAAAGGVGTFAIQFARLMGAEKVIGTASNEIKLNMIRHLGADAAIDYTQKDWVEQVKRVTDGRGVDIILDSVGGKIAEQSLQCLAPFGRMVVIGASSGQLAQFASLQLMTKNQSVIGHWQSKWSNHPAHSLTTAAEELLQFLASDRLQIIIGQTFPLSEVAEAHRAIAERQTIGKVVLLIDKQGKNVPSKKGRVTNE